LKEIRGFEPEADFAQILNISEFQIFAVQRSRSNLNEAFNNLAETSLLKLSELRETRNVIVNHEDIRAF
jgi:hypothetical protein